MLVPNDPFILVIFVSTWFNYIVCIYWIVFTFSTVNMITIKSELEEVYLTASRHIQHTLPAKSYDSTNAMFFFFHVVSL